MLIHVFIFDEDPVSLAGLCAIIDRSNEMDVAGTASHRDCLTRALREAEDYMDVALMSYQRPERGMADMIRAVRPLPSLVFSRTDDDDAVVAALRAGAHGYIVKISSPDELLRSIQHVADGGAAFCSLIAPRLTEYFSAMHDLPGRLAFPSLTDREREILDLIASGLNNRQIARKLVLSEKTVRNHITRIFVKLQVTDRTAAAVRARDAGVGIT
jgi:DNA-binding NarL/FixJ family response regulator